MFYPFTNQETQCCLLIKNHNCQPFLPSDRIKILTQEDGMKLHDALVAREPFNAMTKPEVYNDLKELGWVKKIENRDGVIGFETDAEIDLDQYGITCLHLRPGKLGDLSKEKDVSTPHIVYAIIIYQKTKE